MLNFACPLHTFAFQSFLNAHGFDNVVIDYKPVYFAGYNMEDPGRFYRQKCAEYEKKISRLSGDDKAKAQAKYKYYQERRDAWEPLSGRRKIRYQKFQRFIDSHYTLTDRTYDSDALEFSDPGCDVYMCVTDVIWRKEPGFGFDRGFFLGSFFGSFAELSLQD